MIVSDDQKKQGTDFSSWLIEMERMKILIRIKKRMIE